MSYELPPELVQIETSRASTAVSTQPVEDQTQERRPRRPPAAESVASAEPEPLVQIETRRETSASE
jgi:hypothetical protein